MRAKRSTGPCPAGVVSGTTGDESNPLPTGTFSDVSVGGKPGLRSLRQRNHQLLGHLTPVTGPTAYPAGRFSHVSVGDGFSCGILADSIQGNQFGEVQGSIVQPDRLLGLQPAPRREIHPTPTRRVLDVGTEPSVSEDLRGVLQRRVGRIQDHGCGLRPDQTIDCWGSNSHNQATPPAAKFSNIAAGRDHTCGIRTDGTVQCWGSNSYGESDPPPGTFVDIAAGGYFSCGIRTDGTAALLGP